MLIENIPGANLLIDHLLTRKIGIHNSDDPCFVNIFRDFQHGNAAFSTTPGNHNEVRPELW